MRDDRSRMPQSSSAFARKRKRNEDGEVPHVEA
jgi:hypothetical protein